MKAFDEQLVQQVDAYIEALFIAPDALLTANIANAEAAGLPAHNVSANEGKLLHLLARIAGARRILEIGTLGGYSTTWLGRALPADGKLISLEFEPRHAATARKSLAPTGLDKIIEIRVGDAAESMRAMIASGEAPFDFIFIDADKPGYVRYLELAMRLSRPGTVIVADNIIRHGAVLEANPRDPNARATRAYNAAVAADARLESIIVPIFRDKLDGINISRVS